MHQWESVKELQWFCERLDLKHIVDKMKLFLKRLLVTEYCITDMLWIVYTLEGICSVVLQVWYRCSFMFLWCYFCSDFSHVVFSQQ